MRTSALARPLGVAALAAALLLPTTGAGASGHGPQAPSPVPEFVLSDRLSLAIDAASLANAHGWDRDDALDHLRASRTFGELAGRMEDSFPDAFASAVFADAPGETSVIRFVGRPPLRAYGMLVGSGLEVELRGGARYTWQQLEARADRVHQELLRRGYPEVVTAAAPGDVVHATVRGRLRPQLPSDLRDGVELEVISGPVATDLRAPDRVRGGAPLLDDGEFECTSGFVVTDGETSGLATAGHCDGLDEYLQPRNGKRSSISRQKEHQGKFGDMAWYATEELAPAVFFAQDGQLRQVTAVAAKLPVGTLTCAYGRRSNKRTCSRVLLESVDVTLRFKTRERLVATELAFRELGDSGGPVFEGTVAHGLVQGIAYLVGQERDVFTRASLLPKGLDGVTVRTR